MPTTPGQMASARPGTWPGRMAIGERLDWSRGYLRAWLSVAYCLVTDSPYSKQITAVQMIAKHIQATPIPPSQRTTKPVSPDLERLIMKCLGKAPMERPQSAAQLAQALDFIPADPWDEDQAKCWWESNARIQVPAGVGVLPHSSLTNGQCHDLSIRAVQRRSRTAAGLYQLQAHCRWRRLWSPLRRRVAPLREMLSPQTPGRRSGCDRERPGQRPRCRHGRKGSVSIYGVPSGQSSCRCSHYRSGRGQGNVIVPPPLPSVRTLR